MITNVECAEKVSSSQLKCLVWDLDGTLWDGILAEGDDVQLFEGVANTVRALDERGILQSIASRNDEAHALDKLRELGLAEYFLHPQIHWGAKSGSIGVIAQRLNIGIETIAFIDDQLFELGEVAASHVEVLCLGVERRNELLQMPEFAPRFVTDESRERRRMYLSDAAREAAENGFKGAREAFLGSLGMKFTIAAAELQDLGRIEELVARTNQLNTTGRIYSLEQLDEFRLSSQYDLWVASLDDVHGKYGKIGLALVEKTEKVWTIKAFLMSCRVMSRGVGAVFIRWLLNRARANGVALRAEMIPNERNRMMIATYRFSGFEILETREGVSVLTHPLREECAYPDYVTVLSG
jgi:FkbH-like protein